MASPPDPKRLNHVQNVRLSIFDWGALMSEEYVTVKVPKRLYEEIRKRVEKSKGEFKDSQEYIEFVLNEIVREEEEPKTAYTPAEEEEIKKRLKQLGYL